MQPVTDALLDRLPTQNDGLILDLACGLGMPTLDAARRNPGARVLGVDRADQVIEAAVARAAAQGVVNAGCSRTARRSAWPLGTRWHSTPS